MDAVSGGGEEEGPQEDWQGTGIVLLPRIVARKLLLPAQGTVHLPQARIFYKGWFVMSIFA